jgi:hypothetical protein
MRVAAGGALLLHAALTAGLASPLAVLHLICAATGGLLIVGLWTPIVGAVAAIAAGLHAWFGLVDAPMYALLAALAAALALLGPGAWSVDARLFGWRRVHISGRAGRRERREPPAE